MSICWPGILRSPDKWYSLNIWANSLVSLDEWSSTFQAGIHCTRMPKSRHISRLEKKCASHKIPWDVLFIVFGVSTTQEHWFTRYDAIRTTLNAFPILWANKTRIHSLIIIQLKSFNSILKFDSKKCDSISSFDWIWIFISLNSVARAVTPIIPTTISVLIFHICFHAHLNAEQFLILIYPRFWQSVNCPIQYTFSIYRRQMKIWNLVPSKIAEVACCWSAPKLTTHRGNGCGAHQRARNHRKTNNAQTWNWFGIGFHFFSSFI